MKEDAERMLYELPALLNAKLRGISLKRNFAGNIENRAKRFFEGEKGARIVLLYGLRGTGKTISLLQLHEAFKDESFYISCDELIGNNLGLEDAVEALDVFFKEKIGLNKKFLLLVDEISYMKDWGLKLKLLYDKRPNLSIIATSSSSVALYSSELERRAIGIKATPLTFREYLQLKESINIEDSLSEAIRKKIIKKEVPREEFLKILSKMGGKSLTGIYRNYLFEDMPSALETGREDNFLALKSMLRKIIYEDFPKHAKLESELLIKGEQLITLMSRIPSDGVRIETLSGTLGISKFGISKLLELFSDAMLIKGIAAEGRKRAFKLPRKWFFLSPSMRYVLSKPSGIDNDIKGNLREDSVFLHLQCMFDEIYYSHEADFVIPKTINIEVGGRKKGRENALTLVEEEIVEEKRMCLPFFLLAV